jgi:prepilin-type N-terminal cleavage/methylation domain-containing protein
MKVPSKGFTLVELMVVVSVLAVLSTILYANFSQARAQSRDAERKSDLRNIQSALELYKQKYGRYPAGCNGAGAWSGELGSGVGYRCSSGSGAYIVSPGGSYPALSPEFIPTLPTDPKLNGNGSGYMYVSNADGSVYKFMIRNTVEINKVTSYEDPLKGCDYSGLAQVTCSASTMPKELATDTNCFSPTKMSVE